MLFKTVEIELQEGLETENTIVTVKQVLKHRLRTPVYNITLKMISSFRKTTFSRQISSTMSSKVQKCHGVVPTVPNEVKSDVKGGFKN